MKSLWLGLAEFSFFETNRLICRPFVFEDWERLYQILGQEDHIPFVFPVQTSAEEAKLLLLTVFLKEPLGKWAIVDKESQRLIGAIAFESISETRAQAEIGYFLDRSYWGRGLMTEALQTLSYLALSVVGFKELLLATHLENTASQQVAKKSGYRFVKQYKGSDRFTHKIRDYLLFQMKACHLAEWLKKEEL